MHVNFVPVTQGMTSDEVKSALSNGWQYIGRQAMKQSQIVDPSKPTLTGIVDVDIWAQPEPMVPIGAIVNLLVDADDQGNRAELLDHLCQELVGTGYEDMREKVITARKQRMEGLQA